MARTLRPSQAEQIRTKLILAAGILCVALSAACFFVVFSPHGIAFLSTVLE